MRSYAGGVTVTGGPRPRHADVAFISDLLDPIVPDVDATELMFDLFFDGET